MNILERAYLAGKQAAEAKFSPVAAPSPKGAPAPQTTTATTSATQQVKPAVKSIAGMGLPARPSVPGMAGSASTTAAKGLGGGGPSSLQASMPNISAPALVQQSAMQFAQNTINSTGTQMLGALPKIGAEDEGVVGRTVGTLGGGLAGASAGSTIAQAMQAGNGTHTALKILGLLLGVGTGYNLGNSWDKRGEFNMGLTPDPSTKSDGGPKGDNGRSMYGTDFTDPTRPSRQVSHAFNALSVPKNHDVLNDAGEAAFGSPGA